METQFGIDYTSVFSVLSELVEIGIVVINPSGEMDFASRRARELLGCGDDLNAPSCHREVSKALNETVQKVRSAPRQSHQREVSFAIDGELHGLMLEAYPIDENDCTGVLIIVKNADNMRKMALDLRMSAQFRNTRRLYESVVRDLKQPLTAVMVHLDLLRDLLGGEDARELEAPDAGGREQRGQKSVRIIKKQVTELNRVLSLLLEEIEPADTEERGFSLRDVLEDVTRLIEPQAAQQAVALSTSIADHAGRMNGSRQRVKQAVLNIAVNALDAMKEGGQLEIAFVAKEQEGIISIKDDGSGIPEHVRPHIFEMHYTTKAAGTGVGLYVARDVIQRHGGRIEVETEVGLGSTFHVILPVSKNGS